MIWHTFGNPAVSTHDLLNTCRQNTIALYWLGLNRTDKFSYILETGPSGYAMAWHWCISLHWNKHHYIFNLWYTQAQSSPLYYNLYRGDEAIKLQIWDTAGQERYRAISIAYYRGADGFAVVFDLTNRESFQNCVKWWVLYCDWSCRAKCMPLYDDHCMCPMLY